MQPFEASRGDPRQPRIPGVIYIISYPRSGSTILGNILGEVPGFFHVGELSYLWERHILRGKRYCGCGLRVFDCPMWSEVLNDGLGSPATARAVVGWRRGTINSWRLPALLSRSPRDRDAAALRDYSRLLARTYERISDVTGADTIIDSSKWPVDAAVVGHLGRLGIRSQFIHLIRDPRAVIHSRQRRAADGRAKRAYPRRALIAYDAFGWMACNLAAEAVMRRFGTGGSVRLLYEDFSDHPRRAVQDLIHELGSGIGLPGFEGDAAVRLGENHGLGGNIRARRARGIVEIRDEREWISGLSGLDRCLISAVTAPISRRYGYPRTAIRPGHFGRRDGSYLWKEPDLRVERTSKTEPTP